MFFIAAGIALFLFAFLITNNGRYMVFLALISRGVLDGFSNLSIVGGLNPASMFGVFITVLILIKLIMDRKRILTKSSLPFTLLVLWSIVLMPLSFNKGEIMRSIEETIKLVSSIAIFLAIIAYATTYKVQQQVLGVAVISVIPSLVYGLIGINSPSSYVLGIGLPRVQSFFTHPNNYAHYLLVLFIFTTVYYEWRKVNSGRFFLFLVRIIQILIVGSILLTFSRSGIVTLGLTILLFNLKNIKSFVYACIILLLIFGIIFYFFNDFVWYTINTTLKSSNIHESSLASRFVIWNIAIRLIQDNWFFGVGPGQSSRLIGIIAHNDYIRVWLEFGLPGIIFYLWGLIRQLFDCLVLKRRAKAISTRASYILSTGAFALFISLSLVGFFGNNFNSTITEWYTYALWGLVVIRNENLAC